MAKRNGGQADLTKVLMGLLAQQNPAIAGAIGGVGPVVLHTGTVGDTLWSVETVTVGGRQRTSVIVKHANPGTAGSFGDKRMYLETAIQVIPALVAAVKAATTPAKA